MIADSEELVANGTLNAGQGKSLIAKLNGALKQLDQGKKHVAVNHLMALVNEVNASSTQAS